MIILKKLNPEKLFVEFQSPTTETEPIIPRKYTLTHSDKTAELFLTISSHFDYEKITPMRDEVLAQWSNNYSLLVYLHIDGNLGYAESIIRNTIFRKELPLALEAIVYGDRLFLDAHPYLNNSSIIIHFKSIYPNLNTIENWGTISDYK